MPAKERKKKKRRDLFLVSSNLFLSEVEIKKGENGERRGNEILLRLHQMSFIIYAATFYISQESVPFLSSL